MRTSELIQTIIKTKYNTYISGSCVRLSRAITSISSCTKYYAVILLLLFYGSSIANANNDVQFRASALENVVVGQQFRVTYTVNQEAKDFRGPDLSDFSVVMGPSSSRSSSYQIINGNATSSFSLTYAYVLMANATGEFTIQPAHITVNGQRYASNSLRIKVVAGNAGNANSAPSSSSGVVTQPNSNQSISDNQIFIKQQISKKKVYEQEALSVIYKLYTRYDVRDVSNAKFPDFKGFFSQEIELPKDRQFTVENVNGVNYNTIVLKQYLLYPQRSGNITIEGAVVDVIMRLSNNVRSRGIFDFFDTFQEVKKTLKTSSETISVKPLPTTSKPSSFQGAVGDLSFTSSLSKSAVKVNEAISFKLLISGNGNLRLLQSPNVKFPVDWEVYEPKINDKFKVSSNGTSGTKEIEYVIIPRYVGEFDLPAVEFSYFDPTRNQYNTIKTAAYTVSVEGSSTNETTSPSTTLSLSLQENVKIISDDIRFIDTQDTFVFPHKQYVFGSTLFWLAYIIPTFLFVLIIVLLHKQLKENADSSLMKIKRANKVAKKRFLLAHNFLKQKNEKSFYDEIMKALWGYLSDKLAITNSDLFKDNLVSELQARGVASTYIDETIAVLNDCEFARFSPSSSSELAMETMYQRACNIITSLESELKHKE